MSLSVQETVIIMNDMVCDQCYRKINIELSKNTHSCSTCNKQLCSFCLNEHQLLNTKVTDFSIVAFSLK